MPEGFLVSNVRTEEEVVREREKKKSGAER